MSEFGRGINFGCGLIVAGIVAVGLLLAGMFALCGGLAVVGSRVDTRQQAVAANVIPGMKPVDVYLNFTDKGFALTKNFGAGGNEWTCREEVGGRTTTIQAFGPTASSVSAITGTVLCTDSSSCANDYAEQVLPYLATVPYDGASREAARDWVLANLGKDKAHTRFGPVEFELSAPTDFLRMLTMRRVSGEATANQQ